MRKSRLVLLIAVITFAGSLIGQQEPLPPIQIKSSDGAGMSSTPAESALSSQFPPPIIDLPIEPTLQWETPTLEGSARNNDFATFDTLYTDAQARGDAAEFSALHDLWTYSVTDRLGAFYGTEMHDRLARAYSGYASYIEPYRIVDDRGAVYYPTAETKTYLLQQAILGKEPQVMIASGRRTRTNEIQRLTMRPSRKRLQKAEATPAPAPAPAPPLPEPVSPPVVVQASNAPPNVAPAPVPAPTPAPAPEAIATPPVQATLVTTPAPEQQLPSAFNARAIIVAIMLFVAAGVLMVMLRASREERHQHVLIPPADIAPPTPTAEANPIAPAKPLDNIEPIRKPSSRASGSRG